MSKQLNNDGVMAGRIVLAIGLGILFISNGAFAAPATAITSDALGTGICAVVDLLTGKWLFGFTILAVLGAGAALLFGQEMTEGLKKIATIVTIVGLILATSSILSLAFSSFSSAAC